MSEHGQEPRDVAERQETSQQGARRELQEAGRRRAAEAAAEETARREAAVRDEAKRAAAARKAAHRAERRRRRRRRRQRPLRVKLLSENLRLALALTAATALSAALVIAVPEINHIYAQRADRRTFSMLMMLIMVVSLHGLFFAALTSVALRGQSRVRLVATARLPRARKTVPLYRWAAVRSGPASEVLQLVMIAGLAIMLLATRPDAFPLALLLGLTVAAIVAAWIGSVMTFAVEYVAVDAYGDGFALPGTPAAQRTLDEYLYAAVLVQASSGSSEFVPLTTAARRTLRNHVILAHVMSTIILTLGVSVVITAVG